MHTGDNNPVPGFAEAMQGVKPLALPARAAAGTATESSPGQARRRAAAVQDPRQDPNPLANEPPMVHGPHDPIEFRRDGVQHGVFRKLKQGGYAIESRLDLHRLTVSEARDALFRFITDCHQHELRTVLVLHGKGERSATPARLKNCVAHWLQHLDPVQAYASAQPHHGGTGAVYVLLRKGEKARQQNALRHR